MPGARATASLTQLLDNQENAVCFHELNPTCAHFSDNFAPIKNTITEFSALLNGGDRRLLTIDYTRKVSVKRYAQLQTLPHLKLLGDIGYYYLSYVESGSHGQRFPFPARFVRSAERQILPWPIPRMFRRQQVLSLLSPYINFSKMIRRLLPQIFYPESPILLN